MMSNVGDNHGPTQPPAGGEDPSPLDDDLRTGLAVIGALALVSLVLCTSLFTFITYRVVQGQLKPPEQAPPQCEEHGLVRRPSTNTPGGARKPDPPPLLPPPGGGLYQAGHAASSSPHADGAVPNIRSRYQGYSPLLVLIYMLLVADMIQSASYMPNLVWVGRGAIDGRSGACWAQGWLRSQGDVASAAFAAAVSACTYLLVAHRYAVPPGALRLVVAAAWSFSFVMVAAGVWASDNGRDHGGYFVRVDTWCWISHEYAGYRIWTHLGWVLPLMGIIALGLAGTAVSMYRAPPSRPGRVPLPRLLARVRLGLRSPRRSGHHPAFLIYPLVYLVCCAPMAVGPLVLASSPGAPGRAYFLWAGAMTASNGWLDVALWGCAMVLLAPADIRGAGLEGFAFLRTPSVEYGNMVWVEAGEPGRPAPAPERRIPGLRPLARMLVRAGPASAGRQGGAGWESLGRPDGITTRTTTTVVVEESNPAGAGDSHATGDILTVPRRVAHRF